MSSTDSCIHAVVFDGMCTECGCSVEIDDRYQQSQNVYILTRVVDEQMGLGELESYLLSKRKLALVVDLDKTLIDTIRVPSVEIAQKVIEQDKDHSSDFFYFRLSEIYLVRVRPHTKEFLEMIADKYYMRVYTLSQRSYALKILEKIDPDNRFFHQRFLAREDGDPSGDNKKKISNIFIEGQHMALIIDDSPDVWVTQSGTVYKGLLQLEPFQFFDTREKDFQKAVIPGAWQDQTLDRIAQLLCMIHENYYSEKPETVFIPIDNLKHSVFDGCYIYFCAIWDVNDDNKRRFYVGKAEEFGATVLSKFLPYCTHIVTIDPTHPDVIEAQKYRGIYIVNDIWFFKSFYNYSRQIEINTRFEVKNSTVSAPLKTLGSEKRTEPPKKYCEEEFDDIFDLLDNEKNQEEELNSSECEEDISFLFNKDNEEEEDCNSSGCD